MPAGLVLIDKPEGITSHDVVARVRKLANTRRVGHAGTLDPMATGLLLLGIGQATKLLTFIVGADKSYAATIRLGASTISDDRESEYLFVADPKVTDAISEARVDAQIEKLRGVIQQVPSSVSAIKVNGERAYAKVRAGESVDLKAREVNISRFERVGELARSVEADVHFADFEIEVDCSSGTYIRALARDLGQALSVGGHLTNLRRTRIADYSVTQAQSLDAIEALNILPLVDAARALFPAVELTDEQERDLIYGKRIQRGAHQARYLAGITKRNTLLAILEPSGNQLKSVVVFPEDKND